MRSQTSRRWIGILVSASNPSRTRPPSISRIVISRTTSRSSGRPITTLSRFFLVSTNMVHLLHGCGSLQAGSVADGSIAVRSVEMQMVVHRYAQRRQSLPEQENPEWKNKKSRQEGGPEGSLSRRLTLRWAAQIKAGMPLDSSSVHVLLCRTSAAIRNRNRPTDPLNVGGILANARGMRNVRRLRGLCRLRVLWDGLDDDWCCPHRAVCREPRSPSCLSESARFDSLAPTTPAEANSQAGYPRWRGGSFWRKGVWRGRFEIAGRD